MPPEMDVNITQNPSVSPAPPLSLSPSPSCSLPVPPPAPTPSPSPNPSSSASLSTSNQCLPAQDPPNSSFNNLKKRSPFWRLLPFLRSRNSSASKDSPKSEVSSKPKDFVESRDSLEIAEGKFLKDSEGSSQQPTEFPSDIIKEPEMEGRSLGESPYLSGIMDMETESGTDSVESFSLPEPRASLGLPPITEIRAAAARLLVFGFHGKKVNAHARNMISLGAGGVILFSRNYEDPEQVATLCIDLKKAAAPRPLIIMIDQEGGGVARLGAPFTPVPWARVLGFTKDPESAAIAGTVLGRELRAVYIDMNLAPVIDVDTNPDNPVIGKRSFGSDPKLVAKMGFSFVRGLQREGVAGCVKHYPGHGDTSVDSHKDLPYVEHSIQRLETVELTPFRSVIEADVAAVLVAHVVAHSLNKCVEDNGRPATMSRGAVQYLREVLNFEGVVLSDCMEMGAIMKNYSPSEASVLGLLAGLDLLLFCHTEERQRKAVEGIVSAVLTGRVPFSQLKQAGERIDDFVKFYVRGPPVMRDFCDTQFYYDQLERVGCKEHQDMIANVQHQAASMGLGM